MRAMLPMSGIGEKKGPKNQQLNSSSRQADHFGGVERQNRLSIQS